MNKNRRAKNPKKTLIRLLQFIFKYYKPEMIVALISIIISSLASISVSLSLRYIVDDYIIPLIGSTNPNFIPMYKMIGFMATIFLIGSIATLTYYLLMVKITQGTLKRIRDISFKHLQSLPINYFDKNNTGNIMSVFTNDTEALRNMINGSMTTIISSSIIILGSFISMLILSPLLSILSFVMVGSLVYITKIIGKNTGKYFGMQQKNIADVTGYIEESMSGQKVIKVFNHEKISKKEFDNLNEELYKASSRANIYANLMAPVIGNMGNLQFVLTAILGGLLYVNNLGGLSVGILVSYLQFTKSFTQPFIQMAMQFNSVFMAIAGAERIFKLIDENKEIDNGKIQLINTLNKHWAWVDENGNLTELKGDIRFENMTFGYDENKIILDNLTLYAKPGQKIAFIGETGAGKTTITNLINRFYEIQKGTITYDGINIKDIKKSDLRKSLGIVLQDTKLFTGTIMENIRYGKLDATDEEVYLAAKLAHADSFIQMLPNGYDTLLTTNAEELSVGQKQLIAIARAAIADPPVLILDEATSNIDTRTEKIVQNGMDNLMKGRTVFVIAHRLSTIKNSDVIIVLENGKIIERGNHDALILQQGKYYQLYTGNIELE
ncbi:ABC transporter ATP-binding protein [Streptobacillus moniliformis]|uniref:ABC transporter related protein n=1 Tax=Streptobacillus moniliformis (strain ATCC 14647 / DSM 12112 / NCTC 10651 / 9901) TaxID=519441 RepID=D1AVB6_STRM9|nr:ABC transporter ATP-binding protein [Streptobacillus moniliformis]ACZ01676.1 ABC transporter related protein [Streptobacillus moniliformis DSM 12112]AVL43747.1 ABC transporter ATP-binding protein [Streptobacillus moniliformis]SQA13145.1 Probable multidrug resistance ABC transporter ATP-binding/permease protein YheH [Streptobacillus moniliformis]